MGHQTMWELYLALSLAWFEMVLEIQRDQRKERLKEHLKLVHYLEPCSM